LELGFGVARASASKVEHLQAHWIALPAGHHVSAQVRRLTGFAEADVAIALSPEDAWDRLRSATEFAAPMPTAIHFAQFELPFLRDWAERFEPSHPFPLEPVWVHAIARRLYPDLPRRSIRALAGFLGFGLDPARRCLGHVEATAHIWQKIVPELESRGVRTWHELGDWLTTSPSIPSRSRKRRYPLPSERYRALPDEPGVYRLLRSNGDILYIGKAASLRKRVASHFSSVFTRTERALEMLSQVSDVQVTLTRTALEAAMLENESIKTLQPPYNVQLLVEDERAWFIDRALDTIAHTPSDDHPWGPLPSTFGARAFGAVEAILRGAPATRALRARAVETAERWAPDEAIFAAGLAAFVERYEIGGSHGTENPRRALVETARRLILTAKVESPEEDDASASDVSELRAWDVPRIVRHLERGVRSGYRLLQRARWLCLLYESVIVFREPDSEKTRRLVVSGGRIVDARDALEGSVSPTETALPLHERRATFDRTQYDRLRTLTSELKRVLRDGGTVEVRIGRTRWLRGAKLDSILAWV
ncbi:MAG: GIY-YIG nuclease family protein, partial [Polyangiaceae bacterium]